MKLQKVCLLAFLFLTNFMFAQDVVINDVKNFDELKVFNGLTVNLIKSEVQKIEISGEKATEVVVSNKKGVLKFTLKVKSLFKSDKVDINLYYNSIIGELDANQGAVITSKEVFKQTQLDVSSQEGAYIKLSLAVDYLKVKAITGGNIQLKGTAKSQSVDITTGSNYNGTELITKQTDISVTTGGEAKIFVEDILDAKVKLGGTIEYFGKTKSVKTTKVMGGSIFKNGEKLDI
ncbi:head GIN domain-containing protein [Flavicella sediminum]|uniref:head GIN domain-containing protein n=1 Tax=Flavicella sediminum TaxID=2585141 RepID=UPI001AA07AD1|nr:head GIN domain-containing protein [Flavicella sediminum]